MQVSGSEGLLTFMRCGVAVVLWSLLAPLHAAGKKEPAPRGWKERVDGHVRTVERGDVRIEIGPWQSMGKHNLHGWLATYQNRVPAGVTLVSVGKIKPEKTGELTVTRKIRFGKMNGQSVLMACPGRSGVARLLQMHIRGNNLMAAMSGGFFIDRVCKRESKGPPVNSSAAAKLPRQERPPEVARDASGSGSGSAPAGTRRPASPGRGATRKTAAGGSGNLARPRAAQTPPGFTEIQGLIVMGIQPGGMFGTKEDFIALFDDGTYTTDLHGAFGGSVKAARSNKPASWGKWRRRGGKLQLRRHGKSEYKKPIGNWRTTPAKPDERLRGCFGRLTSTSGADYNSGTTVGVASSWCFWPNGRFTNSSTAFGNSSDGVGVTMRATSPKARGRYRLDGYGARFVYDDGHEVTAAFCFANDDNTHIALNGRRFMGRKR